MKTDLGVAEVNGALTLLVERIFIRVRPFYLSFSVHGWRVGIHVTLILRTHPCCSDDGFEVPVR